MSRLFALLFGIAFLGLGALGYFPNSFVGPPSSEATLQVNDMHTYLHLATGALLLVGTLLVGSRPVLLLAGVVYVLLAVAGFLLRDKGDLLFGQIYLNEADRWFNVGAGAALLVAGLLPGGRR